MQRSIVARSGIRSWATAIRVFPHCSNLLGQASRKLGGYQPAEDREGVLSSVDSGGRYTPRSMSCNVRVGVLSRVLPIGEELSDSGSCDLMSPEITELVDLLARAAYQRWRVGAMNTPHLASGG
jgi:hypothetical protein